MLNHQGISLLLLNVIISTYGFTLFDEIELTWTFPTDGQISFNLSVPLRILEEDEFHWAFFGFKMPVSTPLSNGTDIMLVNFISNSIEDRFRENLFPLLDKDLGGTDDLILKSIEIEGTSKNYLWSREFLTLDTKDVTFIAGKQYILIWACGSYYENGKPKIIKSGNTFISFGNDRRLANMEELSSGYHRGVRRLQGNQPPPNGNSPPPQNNGDNTSPPPPSPNGGNDTPPNKNCSGPLGQNSNNNDPSQNCTQGNSNQNSQNDQNENNSGTNSSPPSTSSGGNQNNQTSQNHTVKLNPLLNSSIDKYIPLFFLLLFF